MAANPFANTYRSFSNGQLYEVLQNKNDYQPTAVEAAATELQSRNLSPNEMELLAKEWDQLQQLQQLRQEKKRALEKKVKGYSDRILDDLNPLAPPTTDRRIRMICISVALIILYSFIKEYKMLAFILRHPSGFDILIFLPYITVPVGTWLFWNKKTSGWVIFTVWLVFTVITIIFSYVQELKYTGGPGFMELLFPKRGIVAYFIELVVYGGLLVYINRLAIKDVFKIKKDLQFYTILTAITVSAIIYIALGI